MLLVVSIKKCDWVMKDAEVDIALRAMNLFGGGASDGLGVGRGGSMVEVVVVVYSVRFCGYLGSGGGSRYKSVQYKNI